MHIAHFRCTCVYQRRDRGVYSISLGRSFYCLHFSFSQSMRPDSWIFVRVPLCWLSNRSLYHIFSVNSSLFAPSRGDASSRCQNIFQIERSNWNWKHFSSKELSSCVPTAWCKRDGFTENIWYKLRLLSQPSCTGTNIQEYASGLMNWLQPKCKQYKLRHQLIL